MNKVLTIDQFLLLRKTLKEPLILTGGCFDIIHIGHIKFFEELENLNGTIIVLLESDKSVQKFKGNDRPIHTQSERSKILSYVPQIAYIVLLESLLSHEGYYRLVKSIKPDIIAITAGDPLKDKKLDQAKVNNAKLVEVPFYKKSHSTSEIARILKKEL